MPARKLSISFRKGEESPVVPEIDQKFDIAKPIVDDYVIYLSEETAKVNSIPISRTEVVGSFGVTQEPQQPKFTNEAISGISETVLDTNFVSNLPQGTIEGFGRSDLVGGGSLVTPDVLGEHKRLVYENTRFFRVQRYSKDINVDPSQHEKNIDATLLSTVGYNDANKFVNINGQPTNKKDQKIRLGSLFYERGTNGENLGKYSRNSNVRTYAETLTKTQPLTIEQLSDIGVNIMFEAAQGQAGFDFVVSTTGSIAEAEARMLLPSEQRLGKRVSLGRFTPAYQYKKLTGVDKQENPAFIDNTNDIQSYGSFYNVYNQFDALVPAGQIALAVALTLGFVALLNSISGILSAAAPRQPSLVGFAAPNFTNLTTDEKHKTLGTATLKGQGVYPTSDVTAGNIITSVLGVEGIFSYTRHETGFCLSAGIQEFFGFAFGAATGTTAGAQAVNSSFKILTESGRLNVVLRELLRSGITLIENIASDPTQLASISGAGNLIRKLRDLKIVRFINVLLGIGDKVLFESDIHVAAKDNQDSGGGYYGISGSVSYIDSLPDNRRTYIAKSRSTTGDLAWSNKTAGMLTLPLYLPNDQLNPRSFTNPGRTLSEWTSVLGQDIQNGLTDINPDFAAPEARMTSEERQKAVNDDRLPAEVVQKVETALEADYMPFYIHDLRTNEILAFHAFLEDVGEDFSIQYSAQEGYGRIDSVQIYKGTTRNVTVNFKMIATNPADHNVMWYKLNKLTTMIYPQWTQGRKVSVGEEINFIQPYSQIPGATPVIRLRLGDLFKSNYSKMAVARLFGITTLEDYSVARSALSILEENPPPQSQQRIMLENLRSGKSFRGDNIDLDFNGDSIKISDCFEIDQELYFTPTAGRFSLEGGRPIPSPAEEPTGRLIFRYKGIRTTEQQTVIIYEPVRYERTVQTIPIISPLFDRFSNSPKELSINVLNNSEFFDRNATANAYEIKIRDQEAQNSSEVPNPRLQNAIEENNRLKESFYDETKNPIMKAFKSSGGKGLAGVITSFKVDYGDAKGNWGLDGSRFLRAPKMINVNLSMAVIHDITPGLDARGIMNAPIWPVGQASNYFVNNGPVTNPTYANPGNNSRTNYFGETDYFDVERQALYINRKKG